MAQIVEPLEARSGRRQSYPWAEWTDGQTRLLKQGEDFHVPIESMRVMLYQRARVQGVKVRVHSEGEVGNPDSLVVRFYTPADA